MTTNEANKNSEISLRILVLVAGGMNIREAMNQVLGAGAVENMINEIYTALRAKAAK